jgi:hypothetical protein
MEMVSRETVLQTLKCRPAEYPLMLEQKFPHILDKLVQLWHTPEAEPYLSDLLQPNGRGGGRMDRGGFPEQAWQELLQLKVLCAKRQE